MDEHRRSSVARGQHFLRPQLAADLVRNAGISSSDLVVDIGAGRGALTEPLRRRARSVVAIEADARLAARLRARFEPDVRIVHGDALTIALPSEPFRVVANLPFAHTTPLLRRLLDPDVPLLRADVVVQWGFAVKRCSQRPSTLLTMSWAPWFELTITRRLPRTSFRPPPAVDAAVVTVTRRPDALLPASARAGYVSFLRDAFPRTRDASDIDVGGWVRLYRAR